MIAKEFPFIVESHIVGVVTDLVYARTEQEAVARVKAGMGHEISTKFDPSDTPVLIAARHDSSPQLGDLSSQGVVLQQC